MTTFSGTQQESSGVLRIELVGSQRYDGPVVLIVGALMTLGAVMVYSASVTIEGSEFAWRQWWIW